MFFLPTLCFLLASFKLARVAEVLFTQQISLQLHLKWPGIIILKKSKIVPPKDITGSLITASQKVEKLRLKIRFGISVYALEYGTYHP